MNYLKNPFYWVTVVAAASLNAVLLNMHGFGTWAVGMGVQVASNVAGYVVGRSSR